MTAKQVFAATEIELSKVQAPNLKLNEFNYLFNKAINQYINKVYNVYDLNQQTTDDLRVLKATAYLTPYKWDINKGTSGSTVGNSTSALHNSSATANSYLSSAHSSIQSLHGATYEVSLPIDYLHLLNCTCIYYVAKTKDCWDAGSYIEIPATRLTADSWATVLSDIYNRPSPMKPYYYIHNQNAGTTAPYSPITRIENGMPNGIDMTGTYQVTSNTTINGTVSISKYTVTSASGNTTTVYGSIHGDGKYYQSSEAAEASTAFMEYTVPSGATIKLAGTELVSSTVTQNYPDPDTTVATTTQPIGSNFPRTFKLDLDGDGTADTNVSLVEKPIGLRAGNTSNVRMEIRYGKDDSLFQLKEVQVDYVKSPQFIRLTQEQLDLTEDTSQIMEFPDYVNQEIINELVHLVMERINDPRLQNNIAIDNSIARPTGQQAQPAQAQS